MADRSATRSDDEMVDRLARLRAVLPQMASDLAASRRHANELEVENRRLAKRVNELESRLGSPAQPRHAGSTH